MKWVVVRDLAEIESATFWRDAPEVRSGELRTEDIQTEVFLMPAASHVEKEGSFTQTQRLVQWRDKAIDPPGDARSDLWFIYDLFKRVRKRYAGSTKERDWPILNLTWDYGEDEPDAEKVLAEINGYDVGRRRARAGLRAAQERRLHRLRLLDLLRRVRRRRQHGPPARAGRHRHAEGGWCRASGAGPGRPTAGSSTTAPPPTRTASRGRSARSTSGGTSEKWTGYDVPDFPVDKPPDYRPDPDAEGMDAIGGADPFIMMADGRAWLYAPSGLLDGPMPTHYEPLESPLNNPLYPNIHANPAALRWTRADNPYAEPGDPRYPCVATTFRLTEHHTAGGMSRWLPWLDELQPEMFAEIDPVLAAERGIDGRRLDDDQLAAGGHRLPARA